jgi:hypothetical protein
LPAGSKVLDAAQTEGAMNRSRTSSSGGGNSGSSGGKSGGGDQYWDVRFGNLVLPANAPLNNPAAMQKMLEGIVLDVLKKQGQAILTKRTYKSGVN